MIFVMRIKKECEEVLNIKYREIYIYFLYAKLTAYKRRKLKLCPACM